MKSIFTVCILGAIISLSAAQVFTLGKFCKSVSTVKPFDLNKYLGDWYEIVKFKASFEEGQKCIKANYQLKENGRVRVDNKGYDADGKVVEAVGEGYIPNQDQPGKLKVRFSDLAPYGDYWILDTDYTTYTLIYSCLDVVVGKAEFAWILSRERTLDQSIKDKLFQTISQYDVNTDNFMIEEQTNCPE